MGDFKIEIINHLFDNCQVPEYTSAACKSPDLSRADKERLKDLLVLTCWSNFEKFDLQKAKSSYARLVRLGDDEIVQLFTVFWSLFKSKICQCYIIKNLSTPC